MSRVGGCLRGIPGFIDARRAIIIVVRRAAATNDAGRLWISTKSLDQILFELSGGDVRRLSADVDWLEAAGVLEVQRPRQPGGDAGWCYLNVQQLAGFT